MKWLTNALQATTKSMKQSHFKKMGGTDYGYIRNNRDWITTDAPDRIAAMHANKQTIYRAQMRNDAVVNVAKKIIVAMTPSTLISKLVQFKVYMQTLIGSTFSMNAKRIPKMKQKGDK